MKLAIMQPYIFPYYGYYQLFCAADKFISFDDVNFISRGWINRNRILISGKEHLFTIPLKDSSINKRIKEIEVDYSGDFKSKFLKKIDMSYRKAPFFKDVSGIIENVFRDENRLISEVTFASLHNVAMYLKIDIKFEKTSETYNNQGLKGEARIIDICRKESADIYINPIGGVDIYNSEIFRQNGITLFFLKPRPFRYKQFGNEFVTGLSMIDVLMFNSPEEVCLALKEYDLINHREDMGI